MGRRRPNRLPSDANCADLFRWRLYAGALQFGHVQHGYPPFGPAGFFIDAHTYGGWFLGSGFEYAVSILPTGFFLKSEYRYSTYQAADLPILSTATGLQVGTSAFNSKKYEQSVRSELVYRFNWH
jgi:opacity protein-like surface antigen